MEEYVKLHNVTLLPKVDLQKTSYTVLIYVGWKWCVISLLRYMYYPNLVSVFFSFDTLISSFIF